MFETMLQTIRMIFASIGGENMEHNFLLEHQKNSKFPPNPDASTSFRKINNTLWIFLFLATLWTMKS